MVALTGPPLALPPIGSPLFLVEVALLVVGLVAAWALYRALRPPLRYNPVVAVDLASKGGMPLLSSSRYRLRGRPDELRRLEDGRMVPVEIKSGRTPRQGSPYPSHRVQLLAYCLLIEENLGTVPPYGLLIYGDGTEFRVPWGAAGRAEVLDAIASWRRPYRGEMDPSPGKCAHCAFRPICPGAAVVRGSR